MKSLAFLSVTPPYNILASKQILVMYVAWFTSILYLPWTGAHAGLKSMGMVLVHLKIILMGQVRWLSG